MITSLAVLKAEALKAMLIGEWDSSILSSENMANHLGEVRWLALIYGPFKTEAELFKRLLDMLNALYPEG